MNIKVTILSLTLVFGLLGAAQAIGFDAHKGIYRTAAEEVTGVRGLVPEGEHKHGGDVSKAEGCSMHPDSCGSQ